MADGSARWADLVGRRRPAPISGGRAMDARSDSPGSRPLVPCRARVRGRPSGSPPSTQRDPVPEQQVEAHTHDQPERYATAEEGERPSEHGSDEHESRQRSDEAASVVPTCRLGPQLTVHNRASCPNEQHMGADQAPLDNQLQRSISHLVRGLGELGLVAHHTGHSAPRRPTGVGAFSAVERDRRPLAGT